MSDNTVIIYSDKISPRLEYAAGVIFSVIPGINCRIVSKMSEVGSYPHIIYSGEAVQGGLKIKPSGLLSETGIRDIDVKPTWKGDMPVLFPSDEADCFPFDIFSAAFYMLSRYEEYLPFKSDDYGRFPAKSSLAFRNNFLGMPVVDLWAIFLSESLKRQFSSLNFGENKYKAIVTFDIDQAFAYRGRGFLRGIGGLLKDITLTERDPFKRFRTIAGKEDDPYDMFGYIEEKTTCNNTDAIFFFPLGNNSPHDRNTSFRYDGYKSLIRRMKDRYDTGIHASYSSFGKPDVFLKERKRYKNIAGEYPVKFRQHWLLLKIPDTYNYLIESGVRHDYTMGFADEPGFRAGIARPYLFYDLKKESVTDLEIVPFQFMDGTLRQYRNLPPERALIEINDLIETTKKVKGLFVSIWHNTSLTERDGWEGWRMVFEETLRKQKQ